MRQLLLLRHAKSSWDDRDLSDHARTLNPRGRAAAAAMREAITRLGLVPDLILVSSANRTLQTLQALEPWSAPPPVEQRDSLYLADHETLLETVQGVAETVRSVMLVGHNPGLHEFAVMLAGAPTMGFGSDDMRRLANAYPSGALAEFSLPGPWRAVREGAGTLVRFICPRDLAPQPTGEP